jgi:hypothetical protein
MNDPGHAAAATDVLAASALGEDLAKLVVIPACAGVGSWAAGVYARSRKVDHDTRTAYEALGRDYGGLIGLGIWLGIVF